MKPRTVIVGDHEDPKDDTTHPIVFEQYLDGRQRDRMPAGRIATLDFELGGDPSEPHVVIASDDGQNAKSGALVWETVLIPGKHTRGESLRHAAMLERRYGACTIARLVLPPELRFVMAEALATPRASPPEPANVEGAPPKGWREVLERALDSGGCGSADMALRDLCYDLLDHVWERLEMLEKTPATTEEGTPTP